MTGAGDAGFAVRRVDPMDAQVRALIAELDAYESALYPAEFNELVSAETFLEPGYLLLGVFRRDALVGIGGLREVGDDTREIKRMYVPPRERRQGIAGLLMRSLEAECRKSGCSRMVLETGISQDAAIELYERHGFERCGAFGDYRENPYSVFYEKYF